MPDILFIVIGFLAVLALLAIAVVIMSKVAEYRNPPIGKFIEHDRIRVHYLESGNREGTPVVLFHGNGATIQDFLASGLVQLLAGRYRVICLDRPGFGYSERPRTQLWTPEQQAGFFVGVLKDMGIRDPVVLGHSWGTLVALALVLRQDYPVRGLVLVSGYYFPSARWDFWLMAAPAVPILGDVLRYTFAPVISAAILPRLLRKLFSPRPVSPRFKHEFPVSLTLRPKQLRAAAEESAFLVPAAARFQNRYSEISCAVRLVHGEGDQLVEPAQTERLQTSMLRALVLIVRDAGHMVHYAHPAEIARSVDEVSIG